MKDNIAPISGLFFGIILIWINGIMIEFIISLIIYAIVLVLIAIRERGNII